MAADLRELERIATRIWDGREDLRRAFGSIDSLGYWSWLMVPGARAHPEILEALPIPGPELRGRVNDASAELFVESGLSDAQNLFPRLERAGLDPARGGRLLDFGCGCGRVLRVAARLRESCELFGADVDADAIGWCRENLGFAGFEVLDPRPPAPFPDGHFDAIWSFSIFTHLPEPLHRAWLEDLHRMLRPGGGLVVTTAGRAVVERFLSGDVHPCLDRPTPAQLRADLPRFEAGGFLYYTLARPSVGIEHVHAEDLYGMAFFDEAYVRARWLDLFELVAFDPAPQDWQDYVVLRRRPA